MSERAERSSAEADGTAADDEPARLRAELEHWRDRALAAERWRDEAWAPLLERAAEARRAEALAARVREMEGSQWWRLGAPARVARSLARAVLRRLRGG